MRVVIVGGGTYGFFIAEKLLHENHDLVVIDTDKNKLNKFDDTYDVMTIQGNGASSKTLIKAGIEHADMIMALTRSDEVNIVACMMAKYYGVNKKIARITNNADTFFPNNSEEYFSRIGIDFLIDPERSCAEELYNLITSSGITEKMSFASNKITLEGFRVPKDHPLIGLRIKDMPEIERLEMRFVAFSQSGVITIPYGNNSFCEGDEVFFMCARERLADIMVWLNLGQYTPKKVVIVGGNHTGLHLAQMLEKDKINVRVIESNIETAEEISDELNKAIVFKGHPTDLDLLEELNLPDVDAYVAVTEDDENNILSCVLTRQMLVKKTYCSVMKSEYADLLPTMMKIDGVVDIKKVVINTVVRFLRKSSVAAAATLREIDAEVIEIIVNQDSKVLNKNIADLKFPSGAIIGAIVRNDEVIFAKGSQSIELHDRLIVFYLVHVQSKINSIFGKRVL